MSDQAAKYTLTDADGVEHPITADDVRRLDEVRPRLQPDGDPLEAMLDDETEDDA